MFLREWCVITRRPNFCVNWFPDVFLMSTKFLALKSQRYFSLLQCYFRYIMANSLFNSFFMCGLTWYLEMSLTTNCGIKLLLINMVEDEFEILPNIEHLKYMLKERPWRGLVYPFIKMTKYTVVLLFKLASFFLPSSRAKLGPQSLVIFVEYKVTFFVSVTYYAWFSLISKEHNITISQVSEKIWFRSGIYSRLKSRCMAHLTFLSSSSGSVNSSWPSPAA